MNDTERTISNSRSGRRAAMARDGRLLKAEAETVNLPAAVADELVASAVMLRALRGIVSTVDTWQRTAVEGITPGEALLRRLAQEAIAEATGGKA